MTILFMVAPLLVIMFSLSIGRYPVEALSVMQVIWCKITWQPCPVNEIYQTVVWDIRLPRAILGAMVGGCLAISGASFQGLFRNPLVNAGLLGVSSGAGFGASLAIIMFDNVLLTYLFAFAFGLEGQAGHPDITL